MGLSQNESFHEDDFLEHARIITRYIDLSKARNVLELAAGKAATTTYLARQHQPVSFTGLDLPQGQLDIRSPRAANLILEEGDYHDLSRYSDNSFDVVYIIEALCHARSKQEVIAEVARILRPGGYFIVFDGYASMPRGKMTDLEVLASDLTYKSMMVSADGHYYLDFTRSVASSGLDIVLQEDLSERALPSMRRLEAKAKMFFAHPKIARAVNRLVPNEVTGNAIAAYLMPVTVQQGLHQYWLTVARKS